MLTDAGPARAGGRQPGLQRRAARPAASRCGSWRTCCPTSVAILVVDRGPGVPRTQRERMFEPFQRLGDTSAGGPRARAGRRPRARRGRRRHAHRRGHPRRRADDGAVGARARRHGADVTGTRSWSSTTSRRSPARSRSTCAPTAGRWSPPRDGRSALDAAADRPTPTSSLLDLGLPDMDGTDVITGLRGWTRVPIVVLSARQHGEDKVEALDLGADDYVTKPFAMNELMARLRAAVRRGQDGRRRDDRGRRRATWSSTSPARRSPATARRTADAHRVGASSSCWPATSAGWSPASSCCARCGGRRTSTRPTTCACTPRSCAASSRTTRRTRGT